MWNQYNYNVYYYRNPGHYHYIIFGGPVASGGAEMITVYIKSMAWIDELSTYKDTVMGLTGYKFPQQCNLLTTIT